MSEEETKGRMKQSEGKIREGVGDLTGDSDEQIKGRTEQAEGKIREGMGKASREIREEEEKA
jgi:uncharacterized protein YjbJ (UPF0337 family)